MNNLITQIHLFPLLVYHREKNTEIIVQQAKRKIILYSYNSTLPPPGEPSSQLKITS